MILFLPSEHSGSVAFLARILWLEMHSPENATYFHFLPDNLQDLQSSLHRGKGTQSDIFGGNIEGSCQGSGLNQ